MYERRREVGVGERRLTPNNDWTRGWFPCPTDFLLSCLEDSGCSTTLGTSGGYACRNTPPPNLQPLLLQHPRDDTYCAAFPNQAVNVGGNSLLDVTAHISYAFQKYLGKIRVRGHLLALIALALGGKMKVNEFISLERSRA